MTDVYVVSLLFRVSHLILVDPWGFPEKSQPQQESASGQVSEVKRPGPPHWVKAAATVLSYFNPLAIIRLAGPWGEAQSKQHANSSSVPSLVFQLTIMTFSIQVQDW